MQNITNGTPFHKNEEELFISAAISDLKEGHTTYVYKESILNKLKEIFKELDIRKYDFYWAVRNKEVK